MAQLLLKPHNNHQLFSDYYLNTTLPQRADWLALVSEAEPIKAQITALFAQYKPSNKEAQLEDDFIKPVLRLLGHTFEVQASLATPDGSKTPDYVFYRSLEALNENKGKKLSDALLQHAAFAVGDAKYWGCPLDVAMKHKGGDPFTNKNPSYQIAFYIQHSGLEWGILTNGQAWRLYHKNTAHKLDSYYEVDLPALLQGGDSRQFLYFYAFFRRAAFNAHALSVSAILQESIDYARGVSNSLNDQVYTALQLAAQGFLDYALNELKFEDPEDPTIAEQVPELLTNIYDSSLIFLYRLLFIFYAEARNLLPIEDNDLYNTSYSLHSLALTIEKEFKAGRKLLPTSSRYYQALKDLFNYINKGEPPLRVSTFNGGLFDPRKHTFLEQYRIGDAAVQQIIDLLARVDGQFVDYRDLSVRNLGTIYEGLLEYHLAKIAAPDGTNRPTVALLNGQGEARKATGSYYTPDYIVKYIVEQTLGPLLQDATRDTQSDKEKMEAILSLRVLDPSMGSGHFLVEATEYMARFLVELNVQPEGHTVDLDYWRRRVAQSCIYGVDLNPLAVELAKLSLWLNTVARDRPLSFLDHHLRTGNALLGANLADISQATYNNGRKAKKQEAPKAQLSLFNDNDFVHSVNAAVNLMWLVGDNPAQTVQQVKEQELLYEHMRGELMGKYGDLANLIISVHYGISVDSALWHAIVDFVMGRSEPTAPQFEQWMDEAAAIARDSRHRFFHWELEFPEVFFDKHGQPRGEHAGFSAIIGNPPWIRQEAFSADKPALASRYRVYHGAADLYTYFVELGNSYLAQGGRFGFIIPNKFVRANYGEPLRQFLTERVTLDRIVDFGDLPVFPDAVTYPMIILTHNQPTDEHSPQVLYTRLQSLRPTMLSDEISTHETLIPRAALTASQWSLSGAATQTILDKMKAIGTPLEQLVHGKLYRGILTGFNEAFVIDHHTRDQLITQDASSAELIKPFVVGKDVKRYRIDYQNRYVIFTRHGTDITKYKAIEQYLSQFRTQLEPRPPAWNESIQGEWPGRKPGPYKWYEIQDNVAYYSAFEQPKITWPVIASSNQFAFTKEGYYSNDKTFFIPMNDLYLLTLLNSRLMFYFLSHQLSLLRGGFYEYRAQTLIHAPVRHIDKKDFTEAQTIQFEMASAYFRNNRHAELLKLVETNLTDQQENVIQALLIYLAQSMLDLNQQRKEALEDLLLGLESVLTEAELKKLDRLWTPPDAEKIKGNEEAQKKFAEAQQQLGILAPRILSLDEDIGLLNEEQWRWLLKKRLSKPDLVALTKLYRKYQPPIATLDQHIRSTDHLIDQIVYRLYGLTEEEMRVVEGAGHSQNPIRRDQL